MCDGKTISFTIPMEKEVLRKTGEMLNCLASEIGTAEMLAQKLRVHPEPPNEPEVDAVAAFNADTPEDMGDRIDENAATGAEATTASVEFDKDGRPWDKRIDSGKKTKTADGKWKLRRGVDKDLVAQILAEYAQGLIAEPAPVTPPPHPPAETTAATPPPPPAEELKTFADLRNLCTMNLNKIQPLDMPKACEAAGSQAKALHGLENEKPEIITAVYKELDRLWATR